MEKKTDDTKKIVKDLLIEKLSEISDAVVKGLGKKDDVKTDDEKKVELAKKVKDDEEKAELARKAKDSESDDNVTKTLSELSKSIALISEQLEKQANPDKVLLQKKDEIVTKAIELAKDMGINAEDADIEFKIMEKKKGEADTKKADDEIAKKVADDVESGGDLESEMASAEPEQRKEALGKYLRDTILN